MSILEQAIRILAPFECLGCGDEGALICSTCVAGLPAVPPRCYRCMRLSKGFRTCRSCKKASSLDRVVVFTSYEGPAKLLVHRLKYAHARAAAEDIAAAMAKLLDDAEIAYGRDLLIVPVPTVPARVRIRGYDQAQLIARALATRTGFRRADILVRVGAQRQVGANGALRRQQMQGAFRARKPYLLQNKHVLLVDDVLTTGSTLEAAAKALRAAGAKSVGAIVFAQA